MKNALFLILLLIPAVFAGGEGTSSIPISESSIISSYSSDYSPINYECNLSESELENIKNFAINNFNITDASLVNISQSSCYSYSDYYSIYVNMDAKKELSDIEVKRISFSLSYSKDVDYTVLMNNKADYFDYTLKNEYYNYYLNNSNNNEYYIMFSYNYNENYTIEQFKADLTNYYESISSEKYMQTDYDYPIIVFKSKTSELFNIIPEFPVYISHYGKDLTFTFNGYSEGIYNLAQIALTDKCSIYKTDSYSSEFSDECYGSYIDKERIYFSVSEYDENYSMYLSVYGVKGYKAEFSANYYGDISEEKVQEFINNALNKYFPKYSFNAEFSDNYASEIIKDFEFEEAVFESLNKTKDKQNSNYYNDNIYVSIIEPHISLYSSSVRISSLDSKIMPPFYGQSTIITKDKIYSSIQLKENNAESAKIGINEMLNGIVIADEWDLNMSLRQYYYYYRGFDITQSISKVGVSGIETSMDSLNEMESSSQNSPAIAGISETKTNNFDLSKFDELETEENLWTNIINFFNSFFI
ncbi:MAG: hypothetical protein PHN56_02425 [Candidatus Nanoarchaeia archaeon]|nr:hypothetical protein [Candidatus Nanoarchaeia archaeon]